MKTETFKIKESELATFINSCNKCYGIKYLLYKDGEAHIRYENAFNLYYLGQHFQLGLRRLEILAR